MDEASAGNESATRIRAAGDRERESRAMSQKQTFRAVIEDAENGGAFVTIPFDVEQVFGKKRVKVKAMIEGEPYLGSLVRMGGPHHILIVRKDIREKIGKSIGDEIEISVEEDTKPRIVELPPDLQQALARDPEAEAGFEQLSYTHQKEYVQWIQEAKREQTRQNRMDQTIARLKQKKKR